MELLATAAALASIAANLAILVIFWNFSGLLTALRELQDKLEEIRCGIVDIETAVESKEGD